MFPDLGATRTLRTIITRTGFASTTTTPAPFPEVADHPTVLSRPLGGAWLMEPSFLERALATIQLHIAGHPQQPVAKPNARRPFSNTDDKDRDEPEDEPEEMRPYQVVGRTAVIAIDGPMQKRPDIMMMLFGGTSTAVVRNQIRTAANDAKVDNVLLLVSSPGGDVEGTGDLADDVAALNAVKPVTAFAEDMCCSAAYFVASQASRIVASKHAEVGSIGVVWAIPDYSGAFAKAGVKVHVLRSAKDKARPHPYESISEADLKLAQERIESTHALFTEAVFNGRSKSPAALTREDVDALATGRVFDAKTALELGLIDAVGTVDDALAAARATPERKDDEQRTAEVADASTKEALNMPDPPSEVEAADAPRSPDGMEHMSTEGTPPAKTPEQSSPAPSPAAASDPVIKQMAETLAKLEAREKEREENERKAREETERKAAEALAKAKADAKADLPEIHHAAIDLCSTPEQVSAFAASLKGAGRNPVRVAGMPPTQKEEALFDVAAEYAKSGREGVTRKGV